MFMILALGCFGSLCGLACTYFLAPSAPESDEEEEPEALVRQYFINNRTTLQAPNNLKKQWQLVASICFQEEIRTEGSSGFHFGFILESYNSLTVPCF